MPQQPECTAEQKKILQGLAASVVRARGGAFTEEELLADPILLHEQVSSIRISWDDIVKHLNMSRNSAYHWYHETYVRHITGTKVTPVDKAMIRDTILRGIEDRSILLDEFRSKLKASLSRNYHRAEFTMTYNNLLRSRCVQAAMANAGITLPSRRSTKAIPKNINFMSLDKVTHNSPPDGPVNTNVQLGKTQLNINAGVGVTANVNPQQVAYNAPISVYMDASNQVLPTPVFTPLQNNLLTNLPFISTINQPLAAAPVVPLPRTKNMPGMPGVGAAEATASAVPLASNAISYELLSMAPPCAPQWGAPISIQHIPCGAILPPK